MQDVRGVERRAAVEARVQVALARTHAHMQVDEPAQADGDRRDARLLAAAVEDDRRVGAALVAGQPPRDRPAAHLLLALDEHADVDGQRAVPGERAGDVQQRQEVALVVGGAPGVQATVADGRLEGRRRPRVRRSGRLDVVVAVDEDGRRGGVGRAQLADGQRVAAVDGDQPPLPARAAHALDDPRGRALELRGIALAGRDRRDPQPVDELVEQRLVHGAGR